MLPASTPRLRFREMTAADLPDVATLDLGGSRGPEGWIEWNRHSYVEHGFGLWVIETHAGEFVGDCGLTMQEVEGEWLVEAGWHVRADLRRQGYAAEAAGAVVSAARAAGIAHLVAIIRPDNVASQGVARRIGLTFEREVDKRGPAYVFGADLGNDAHARALLEDTRYVVLASADDAGAPWATPVWFAPDGLDRLFWLSWPGSRHSRLIRDRPEIALTVFDSTIAAGEAAAFYATARAEECPDEILDDALVILNRRSAGQGLPRFGPEDVTGEARLRVYVAVIDAAWVLDRDADVDQRAPIQPST